LEKIFHAKWWSYDNEKFNLNGRVALRISLFWGIMGTFVIIFVQPSFDGIASVIYEKFAFWPSLIILTIMLADSVYTLLGMVGLRHIIDHLYSRLNRKPVFLSDTIEFYESMLNDIRKKGRLHYGERRILKSFSDIKSTRIKQLGTKVQLLLKADKNQKTRLK
jgi:uncharacterized membrane protein